MGRPRRGSHIAVDPKVKGRGIGHTIVDQLLTVARELQLQRLFVLTFETEFFARHGFAEIEGTPVTSEVYDEMCRSYDIGVAEFLDLSYVKPNILATPGCCSSSDAQTDVSQ